MKYFIAYTVDHLALRTAFLVSSLVSLALVVSYRTGSWG
jgi:hypothetical protein